MRPLLTWAAWMCTGLAYASITRADEFNRGDAESMRPLTVAVFGDWPYSQYLLEHAHLLVNSVNADPDVGLVVHVGDIHTGSMPCASAGKLPTSVAANRGWNQAVYDQFQQFTDPVVYTPGDNEWADCHKRKPFSSSTDPLKELASIRNLFFATPGTTLGKRAKRVRSQADSFDAAHPTDSQFVENVMWEDSKVVFATFNMPGGSNNDTSPWTGALANPVAQAQEVSERSGANLRWLEAAFDVADEKHARAVVIALQADMWDPEAIAAGGAGLDKYSPFVQKLADLSVRFGKPVLLLNGDSHVYLSDKPLADPTSTTGVIHHTRAVPNLTRVVVQGSTTAPGEWLKLTIDPRKVQVFSWENVVYCSTLATTCQ